MSLLNRLLGRSEEPKARVRVCVECGMPIDQHRSWCAIDQMRREGQTKAPASDERASR